MVMVMVGGLEFGKSNNKRYAGPQFNKVWCGYASNRGVKRNYKFVTFCVSIFVSSIRYSSGLEDRILVKKKTVWLQDLNTHR